MRRFPRCVAPGLLAAAAGAGLGCGTSDIPVLLVVGGADQAQAPMWGSRRRGLLPTRVRGGRCRTADHRPPASSTRPTVASDLPDQLAQKAFRYALCLCNNYAERSRATTTPSTARTGLTLSRPRPPAVWGVNGDLHPTVSCRSTALSGPALDGHHDVHRAGVRRAARAGRLHPSPMLVVQADAWMASGIQTMGDVTWPAPCTFRPASPRTSAGPSTTADRRHSFPSCPRATALRRTSSTSQAWSRPMRPTTTSRPGDLVDDAGERTIRHLDEPAMRADLPHADRRQRPVHLTARDTSPLFVGGDLRRRPTSNRRAGGERTISSWAGASP